MSNEMKVSAAHDLMVKIQRELTVGKDEYNKFGGYAFRNAEGILNAAKPLITAEDGFLYINTETEMLEDGILWMTVTVSLCASDGSSIKGKAAGKVAESRKGMVEEQLVGSARSYYLKYALMDLLAISDGTDDPDARDNRDAGGAKPRPKQKVKAETAEEVAKRELWDACKALALVTGRDAKAVAAEVQKQEGFTATVAGYKDAAARVRKLAEENGAEYATEDIDF